METKEAIKEGPRKVSDNHMIIERLVTVEFSSKKDKDFWGREMKLAGTLLKRFKREVLFWVPPPSNYKMGSLVWFITGPGVHYLTEQFFEYQKANRTVDVKTPIVLQENKVGEDLTIIRKPKTIKEFLMG